MTIKKYRTQNVFDAAQERLNYVFDRTRAPQASHFNGR